MKKTDPAKLKQLRDADLQAANAWVAELMDVWGLRASADQRWIEPAELYDFGDTLVFCMNTVRYIVTHAVTYDQVQEWQDYVFWAEINGFQQPSLQEYVEAKIPLVSCEAQNRINELRFQLEKFCNEERDKLRKASKKTE